VLAQASFHFAVAEANGAAPAPEPPPPPAAEPEPVAVAAVIDEKLEEPIGPKDLDRDGLTDEADACPALNGPAAQNGCPDHIAYARSTGALALTPPPTFKSGTATLVPRSLAALESLAGALASSPKLRVFVTVHVDPKLQPAPELAELRARALAAWLLERGAKPKQLELYDCGVQRPGVAGPRQRAVHERSEWFLISPLPEQGMPSSIRCSAVELAPSAPAAVSVEPEVDSDGDGLTGAADRCPLDPGTAATQGCSKDVHVNLEAGRIELLRPVTFTKKGVNAKRSPLRAAAQVLKSDPSLRLDIQARAAAGKEADVACKEASAVQAYLVGQGIAAERLAAHGCAARANDTPSSTPVAREKNARIDLRLLPPAPKSGVRSDAGCVPCE
jgi:outer membrane protein OmpA-like peptidoglycan-associated protein